MRAQRPSDHRDCALMYVNRNGELRNERILLPSVDKVDFQDTPGEQCRCTCPHKHQNLGETTKDWVACGYNYYTFDRAAALERLEVRRDDCPLYEFSYLLAIGHLLPTRRCVTKEIQLTL